MRYENAFTLMELLVVVAIVGVLSAIAIPQFQEFRLRSQLSATFAEFKLFEKALIAYNMDANSYPVDTLPGVYPTEMRSVIQNSFFSETTPIGGRYDYEGPPNWNIAGISVRNSGHPLNAPEWSTLDSMIDDGDLSTGKFRRERDWYVYVIIENP